MAFLFRSKSKSPGDLVKSSCEAFSIIDKKRDSSKAEKAVEQLTQHFADMKRLLYGDDESEPNQELALALTQEVYGSELITLLVIHFRDLEFECRKDACQVFNNLLRKQVGGKTLGVEYMLRAPVVIERLVRGYENGEISIGCGSMLRECLRHEPLCKQILSNAELFSRFFEYVDLPEFDVAADAFASFKDLLTKHKALCAEFLESNFDTVFEHYTKLLNSTNYVTRRQSLKLLGELLLDRANFKVMTQYITRTENLKLMMMLLRDPSKSITFEAFHVFKVFVANPNKPRPIRDILLKNQAKLITFLTDFHCEREDEQFNEEKQLLLREISALQPIPSSSSSSSSSGGPSDSAPISPASPSSTPQ